MRRELISSPTKQQENLKPEMDQTIDMVAHQLATLNLCEYEREKIEEVQKAMSMFANEYSLELVGQANESDFVRVINSPGFYVKKVINFCKSLAAFRCLKEEDQLILLKAFYPRMSALYAAFIYKVEKDGFPVIMVS